MELISIIIAVLSIVISFSTYVATFLYEKRKATVESFNILQNEVLDKFLCIKNENAKIIIANLDNVQCKDAYDGYRALLARLEQFAVGVNKRIYDFKVVDTIAGKHLIFLYKKIKPIIDKANEREEKVVHYCNFVTLVEKLNSKHQI
ncbi:MAG: hypothetical protein IJN74_03165 [Clostridia bacterium]|nr:hypothetical protein [Clostridia bacterium]